MTDGGVVYTNWRQLLLLAREASERARVAVVSDPFVASSDAIVAIVMAACATECFINEFAEVAAMTREGQPPSLGAMADAVLEVESDKGSLKLKFLVAAFALTGEMFNKGAQPWQDFAALIGLRNALVHLRPLDRLDDEGQVLSRISFGRSSSPV